MLVVPSLVLAAFSSPLALLSWGVALTGSWHSEVLSVPKSIRLWCWHLLHLVSACCCPLQRFGGWQGFDGTWWQVQLRQVTEGTLEMGSSTRDTPRPHRPGAGVTM